MAEIIPWGRPGAGCAKDCHQGRAPERCTFPCPHRPADVASMREMGVDLRPQPQRRSAPNSLRWLGAALLVVATLIVCVGVLYA